MARPSAAPSPRQEVLTRGDGGGVADSRGTLSRATSHRTVASLLAGWDGPYSSAAVPLDAGVRAPPQLVRHDSRRGQFRATAPVLHKGVLKKRTTRASSRLSTWNDKFFVLRGVFLEYYNKSSDSAPRCVYSFLEHGGCEVSPAVEEVQRSGGRPLYVFKLFWPDARSVAAAAAATGGAGTTATPAAGAGRGGAHPGLAFGDVAAVPGWNDTDGEDEADGSGRSAAHASPGSKDGFFFGQRAPGSPCGGGEAGLTRVGNNGRERQRTDSGLPEEFVQTYDDGDMGVGEETAFGSVGGGGGGPRSVRSGALVVASAGEQRQNGSTWSLRRRSGTNVISQRRNAEAGGTQEETRNETILSLVEAHNKTRERANLLKLEHIEQILEREQEPEDNRRARDTRAKVITGVKVGAALTAGVTVGALTAGVGLLAGLVVLGVGAATTGAGGMSYFKLKDKSRQRSSKPLILASDSREAAEEWRAKIEAQIRSIEGLRANKAKGTRVPGLEHVLGGSAPPQPTRFPAPASRETDLERVDKLLQQTSWVSRDVVHGIRIFEEEGQGIGLGSALAFGCALQQQLQERPCNVPTFKAQIPVRASPLETFLALMASPRGSLNGVVNSLRVVETVDDYSDVIHLCVRQAWVALSWTSPRDFCLARHWRLDDDGCYVVCLDSTTHAQCPPIAGHVRGELNAVYTISPRKDETVYGTDPGDCLLTHFLRVDPRGWIWHKFGCTRRYNLEVMMHILDIRDVIEGERFCTPTLSLTEEDRGPRRVDSFSDATAAEARAAAAAPPGAAHLACVPSPALRRNMWAEVNGGDFLVRGPSYDADRVKVASAPQVFRLVAVDLFEVTEPTLHIAGRPDNRVQLARQAGETSFTWILQIMVPGPPYYSFVCYFTPEDPSILKEDTPFSRIARPCFFGEDDRFRDERLKLIPKVVEGNWVVKRATGGTPAILGTKLRQVHFRGDNYLETDVDIGSSSVAASVTRLSIGYAKTLVVDLAWTLQGNTEDELPEVVLGGVRCNHIDMSTACRLPGWHAPQQPGPPPPQAMAPVAPVAT